ncbi:hypothetical protein D3C85_1083820 [compost metagenome]
MRAQFVTLVDDRPQETGGRLDRQGCRVANACSDRATRAGRAVDFPDHGPLLLHRQSPFADIGVGADADIKLGLVRADSQGLGPVVVYAGGQCCDPLSPRRDTGLPRLEGETGQRALFGDVEVALHIGQTIWRIQIIDQHGAKLGDAVVIGVAQQGDAVAPFDLGVALLLDETGDHVLGAQRRRMTAAPFGDEHIAVRQDQHLAWNLQVGREGADGKALGHDGRLAVPAGGRTDLHGRNQGLVYAWQVGSAARLVQLGIAGVSAGGHGKRHRKGRDAGGKQVLVHQIVSRAE